MTSPSLGWTMREGMAGWCASFIRVSESPQRNGFFPMVRMGIVQTARCAPRVPGGMRKWRCWSSRRRHPLHLYCFRTTTNYPGTVLNNIKSMRYTVSVSKVYYQWTGGYLLITLQNWIPHGRPLAIPVAAIQREHLLPNNTACRDILIASTIHALGSRLSALWAVGRARTKHCPCRKRSAEYAAYGYTNTKKLPQWHTCMNKIKTYTR